MKVESKLSVYEVDGSESPFDTVHVLVRSHWNRRDFVVIETPDGHAYTVNANDLDRGTANAKNWKF